MRYNTALARFRDNPETGDRRLKGKNSTEKKRQLLPRNESRMRYDVKLDFRPSI